MSPHATWAQLLESGRFSDITIQCGVHEFKCHKSVVCMQSSVFDAAFNSEFQESTSSTMTLREDDLAAVRRMITFLYTEDYSTEEGTASDSIPDETNTLHPLEQHLAVYMVADKYGIDRLMALAHTRISALLTDAEKPLSKDTAMKALSEYICHLSTADAIRKEFLEWLVKSRTSSPDERNDMALELHKDDTFRDHIRSNGDFALQYMEEIVERLAVAEKRIAIASSVLGEAYKKQHLFNFRIMNLCKKCVTNQWLLYGRYRGPQPDEPRALLFVCGLCNQETCYARTAEE